jgi:hypothetical protein
MKNGKKVHDVKAFTPDVIALRVAYYVIITKKIAVN